MQNCRVARLHRDWWFSATGRTSCQILGCTCGICAKVAKINAITRIPGGAMSVEQKVKQIIVEQLGVDESQVDSNASFVDDLGADSLDIVELVMAFEEAFELEIPDEDAEKITTVKDAVEYIENKTSKK